MNKTIITVLTAAALLSGCSSAAADVQNETAAPAVSASAVIESAAPEAGMAKHSSTILPAGEPVTELDEEGIATLLTIANDINSLSYGLELRELDRSEADEMGLDSNSDYALVENYTSKDEVLNMLAVYADESLYNPMASQLLFMKDDKLILTHPAMGAGHYSFDPAVWEQVSDNVIHAQFILEGDPVDDVYAAIHLKQLDDRWIVESYTMPDYQNNVWKNPDDE